MVIATAARYCLRCESLAGLPSVWRFELTEINEDYRLEISDFEPLGCLEQSALLAVVRGLEAIDRHAQIDLLTSSRYVQQGILYGLTEWREDGWKWEHFGRMVPIKHLNLWRRVDRALEFHKLSSVVWTPPGKQISLRRQSTARPLVRIHRISLASPGANFQQGVAPAAITRRIDPRSGGFRLHVAERYTGAAEKSALGNASHTVAAQI
jgi:hypothetical protein